MHYPSGRERKAPSAAPGVKPSLYSSEPVSSRGRLLLSLAATAVALCFYLYALLCVVGILVLLAVLVAVALALLRFGLTRFVTPSIAAQFQLMAALLMSLRLWKDPTQRLKLQREDAPDLVSLIEEVARRVGAAPPSEVLLEMGVRAGVRLPGHRRQDVRSTLLLGYDLLAALGRDELEAVIAHEMAHARLVQRGYQGWLVNALARISRFASITDWAVQQADENGARFYTARAIRAGASFVGRSLSRLVAALSREDEFAADRLAGEVCGAATFGRALLRTIVAGRRSEGVSWRERVVHAQRGAGFRTWLSGRLAPETEEEQRVLRHRILEEERPGEFDSHPRIADRLRALGCDPEIDLPPVPEPSSAMLTDADGLAQALILHQHGVEAEAQQRAWHEAAKSIRREYRPRKKIGVIVVGLTLIPATIGIITLLGAVGATPDQQLPLLLIAGAAFGLACVPVWVASRRWYRPLQPLPVPSLAAWDAALAAQAETRSAPPDLDALGKELEAAVPPDARPRKRLLEHRVAVCCDALARCDYARALAAGRFAVRTHRHCLEGLLATAIGAAYFGDTAACGRSLGTAVEQFGAHPCACWGIAWAEILLGEWAAAGRWLYAALEQRPKEATLWSLLGRSQWQARHLHEALRSLEQAVSLEPDEPQHRFPLVEVLLDLGRPADAAPYVAWLEERAPEDYRVLVAAFRIDLLLGRREEAVRREGAILSASGTRRPGWSSGELTWTPGNTERRSGVLR